jgi:hypothetical protein
MCLGVELGGTTTVKRPNGVKRNMKIPVATPNPTLQNNNFINYSIQRFSFSSTFLYSIIKARTNENNIVVTQQL